MKTLRQSVWVLFFFIRFLFQAVHMISFRFCLMRDVYVHLGSPPHSRVSLTRTTFTYTTQHLSLYIHTPSKNPSPYPTHTYTQTTLPSPPSSDPQTTPQPPFHSQDDSTLPLPRAAPAILLPPDSQSETRPLRSCLGIYAGGNGDPFLRGTRSGGCVCVCVCV